MIQFQAPNAILYQVCKMFNQHNALVKLFKTSIDNLPVYNYGIKIQADKTPVGVTHYNVPTINVVVIIIVG